jgi:hypothetical protein
MVSEALLNETGTRLASMIGNVGEGLFGGIVAAGAQANNRNGINKRDANLGMRKDDA